MARPHLLSFFITLLISTTLLGQSGKQPTATDISLAKSLGDKYEDTDIVAKSISEHYIFSYDDAAEQVVVYEQNHEQLMALKAGVSHQPFEFYDDMSTVVKAAATYQNKKKKPIDLRREKYTSQDFFHCDTKVAFFNLQFESLGFQYNIHFDKKINDVKYLTSVYFHESIPSLSKTISFSVPSWLDVELKEMNFDGYAVQKSQSADGENTKYEYTLTEIDARISERNAPGSSHIYPHILVMSKSYEHEGHRKNLFSNTQDLYNWYSSLIDMMDDDVAPLQSLVTELTADQSSDIGKVKSIYYWIQDNIRYIAFEDGIAGFKPDECQNVLEKKYGDCKGMANLCKQMLTLAGFDARLTWIGTKRIAYDYSLPTLSADNHMICTVMLDGKPYFLDPTESYGAFDEYAERIQGRPALIENGDKYILETVPVMTPDHLNNTETNDRQDRLKSYINEGDKNYKVSDMINSSIDNRDQAFKIDYDVQIENKVSAFGDEIYLSVDYYQEWKGGSIDERKLDLLLPYKSKNTTRYIIDIPEGFKVSELPESINISSEFMTVDDKKIKQQRHPNKAILTTDE